MTKQDVPEGIMTKCPNCKKILYSKELIKNLKVCLHCGYHHTMTAYERIDSFLDEGSFAEINGEMITVNPLHFPGYLEKVEKDRKKTNLNEAVVTGLGTVNGMKIVVAIMDSTFRMASMGSVVGEKITWPLKKRMNYHFRLLSLLLQAVQECKREFLVSCKWLKQVLL